MNKFVKVALVVIAALGLGYAGFAFIAKISEPAAVANSVNVVEVTTATFEKEVLNSDVPVIIDFNATWCGPCKTFKPVFNAAADQYKGKVKFVSIDVDKSPEVAALFGIQAIPTVLFLKTNADGSISGGAAQGALNAEQFKKLLDYCLDPNAKLIKIFDKKADAPKQDEAPKVDEQK